jgi:hypothetical protein
MFEPRTGKNRRCMLAEDAHLASAHGEAVLREEVAERARIQGVRERPDIGLLRITRRIAGEGVLTRERGFVLDLDTEPSLHLLGETVHDPTFRAWHGIHVLSGIERRLGDIRRCQGRPFRTGHDDANSHDGSLRVGTTRRIREPAGARIRSDANARSIGGC